MNTESRKGRIVSFYSFKGGVGRTMALANVAFLAAMNELNVLVMDWDLEAPGLHHYFRGLLEPDEMAKIRGAAGILDLAWEWQNGIDAAKDPDDIDSHFANFRSGAPFEALTHRVWGDDIFDEGRLDIIPAGGDMIATPDLVEYERALAAMSWNDLLDRYAGGGFIDALRQWAAQNYDLILVDSRTGLADVAGICTMQLPDAVVLSFVLNRQNIEGVARVASAIRRTRGNDLKIWTVPMRVSREGTDEEADALARALRELTRPGRLDRETTEYDLKNLQIKAEPNVPFMESLSAFNDTNAALDPLTANMARLTSVITDRSIAIPDIPEAWRDVVSSRLAPTLSTDSYLRQLLTAEPGRAGRQLHGYVESAISTLVDGDDLADDYVAALAETAILFEQRSDLHLGERYDILNRVIVLLRKMHERDPSTWRQLLAAALETSLESNIAWLGSEDEILALDEIDEILAAEIQTLEIIERRVETRMRAARLHESTADPLQLLGATDEALALIRLARKQEGGEKAEWRVRQLDAMLLRASAYEKLEQPEEAVDILRKIIRISNEFGQAESPEGERFIFEASFRLMRHARQTAGDRKEAARLALDATRAATPNAPSFLTKLPELAEAIVDGPSPAASAAELLRRAVAPPAIARAYAQLFGRAASSGARVTDALTSLLGTAVGAVPDEELAVLAELSAQAAQATAMASFERAYALSHRRGVATRTRQPETILKTLVGSLQAFIEGARKVGNFPHLNAMLDELAQLSAGLELRVRDGSPGKPTRRSREDV